MTATVEEQLPRTGGLFQNKVYDALKVVTLIILPASATLYYALGQIWGWPHLSDVMVTITAVDAFLGAMLKISNKQYWDSTVHYDGALVVKTDDPDKDVYSFEVDEPLENLRNRGRLNLEVKVDPTLNPPVTHIKEPPTF